MVNLTIKAIHEVLIEPENMNYSFVSCKVQPDDLADMISSMSAQEQIMVLDAMDQNVVQHWYKQRFKLI